MTPLSTARGIVLPRPIVSILALLIVATVGAGPPAARKLVTPVTTGEPRLEAIIEISDYVAMLPLSAPAKYREFRGLLLEENVVRELYPTLTQIFFDAGSAAIPERYERFADPSRTERFADTNIPGGTLQKYYRILNIIGYRMQQHPDAKIEIVGCNSRQPALGETREVAAARGQVVYDYLMNIWQIDPSRMKLLPARDYPEARTNSRDSLGVAENRRAEIRSRHWEIVKPINNVDLRRYPQPDVMRFRIRNGVPDHLVAGRTIEITRGGRPWHTIAMKGGADTLSPGYDFSGADDEDLPTDETPYVARLVVRTTDGRELRSKEITIPVLIVTNEEKRVERCVDKRIDRYSLVLFPFGSTKVDSLGMRILREYVFSDIRRGARIDITGHSDIVEGGAPGSKLTMGRARAVRDLMKKNVRAGVIESIECKGTGAEDPLYKNATPEERAFNRTVQVVIEIPSPIHD